MNLTLGAILSAGLLDSINPCAIGIMLLFISLLFSLNRQRTVVLFFGAFYIVAVYVTYLLIGLGILKAVHLFGVHGFFGYAAAILLIFMGIIHIGPSWLNRFKWIAWMNSCHIPANYQKHLKKGSIIGGLILGVLVAICEFPCSGGVYLATIGLLSIKTTFLIGVMYLLLYIVMFVLPLVLIFLIAGNKNVLEKTSKWQQKNIVKAKTTMCIIMVVLGLSLIIVIIV